MFVVARLAQDRAARESTRSQASSKLTAPIGHWWRRIVAQLGLVLLIAGTLAVTATPAMAAFSAPTAIGVGAPGDSRVWTVVDTAAGSRLRARTYTVGLPGTASDDQKWQWERVAYGSTSGITFRIRNVAAQRCLDITSGILVINNCGTATSQRWRAPLTSPTGGWTLVNQASSQCVSVNPDPNPGALMTAIACSGSDVQRWRLRAAPRDCTVRSRDWLSAEVCATQDAERMIGLMVNWKNQPVGINWLDPEDYFLTNTVTSHAQLNALNPDGSPSTTNVEYGIRADRSVLPSGSVAYAAYVLEWNGVTEQYRAISAAQAPGSNTADGVNHTFMLLGNGNAGEWDLLYDFNYVASTVLQAGGSSRFSRAGQSLRYAEAVSTPQPFTYRMWLMDANSRWRHPYLSETGTGEAKKCDTPPRSEDWIYDVVNVPPNCIETSYKAIAAENGADPEELDSFTVSKALTLGLAAAPAKTRKAGQARRVHHGVDQDALAACMDTPTNNCLESVPGLAACVKARQVCNISDARGAATVAGSPITAAQAVAKAQSTFSVTGQRSPVTVMSQTTLTKQAGGANVDGRVHVVKSSDEVRSLSASNEATYHGYTAVYDAITGALLRACLGKDCATEF